MLKYRPAPPLNTLVECFWWSRRDGPLDAVERMLPTGAAHLVFALHDLPLTCVGGWGETNALSWKRYVAHGPQSGFYIAGPKPAGAVAGVVLRPAAAGAIFGAPSSEIAERHIKLDALWGARADRLHERLCEAPHPAAVFRILEQELLARQRQPLLIHPAVAHAIAQARRPRVRVDDLRRELSLSPRHFIHLFHTAVGLTPGRYYRVRRFARILRAVAQNGSRDLAGLAADAGYSDQSHLIREFRAHAGMTPTQYRPAGPESPHHHLTEAHSSKRS
jgi:AraC-like DNA-binding protein